MFQPKKHRIAIIGSGPVGLYTAILLKWKYGESIDVTLIDSHINDYERPGIIAKKAVQIINSSFQSRDIPEIDVPDSGGEPANSVFIGDLQKSLLKHAQKLGVNLVEDAFASLEENTITTKKGQSMTSDLVIDCSGEGRVVANFTNKRFGGDSVFNVETIAENPIKQHFIAYVHMDVENSNLCRMEDLKKRDPVVHAKTMEELRKTFGWKEFADPEMVVSKWDQKTEGARYCFYFEVPSQVAQAGMKEQEAYLKALLLLKTGKFIAFEREEGKFKFIPFDVDPKRVLQPVNTTNYSIPVVVCGDALVSAEYRFGTGVANGVTCASGLVNSIEVTPKEVVISKDRFEIETRATVESHVDEIKKSYQSKRSQLSGRNLVEAFEMYTKALKILATSEESESDLLKIEGGLFDLAAKFKESAREKFLQGVDSRKKEQHFIPFFQEAEALYKHALDIYENYCPNRQETKDLHSERAKIYSNLSRVFYQTGRIDEAIQFAEQSLNIAIKYDIKDMFESAFVSLEGSCKKALSDYNKDFPNSKWGEKIELNEKMAKMASQIGKDVKPYQEELERLKQKLLEAQSTMKSEMSTMRPDNDEKEKHFNLGN
ncbi:tetratricopeptide repeat protein [Legionella spiritensis]|uniref:Tryptophan halogenase n=1 Tax=Legionella spiritensis TaxID=452 RepID=A0A0W0Z440_LEGSP|nr:tetratricopeptide repeat protein [Legionella spiritensis]KTD63913.1 Tryptophan halogenase [Legionella spiritensis]SNV36485.1 Tryptophan halogenase [Legionella spiritensis]